MNIYTDCAYICTLLLTRYPVEKKFITPANCQRIISNFAGVEVSNGRTAANLIKNAVPTGPVLYTHDTDIYLASAALKKTIGLFFESTSIGGRSSVEKVVCSDAVDMVAKAASFIRVCLQKCINEHVELT